MADEVRETLRTWIGIDDQIRTLQRQIKELRDQKNQLGGQVMEFMRGNNLDNFVIEGGGGTIARQQRTTRARPNRQVVRTQVALLLADQPHRMAEVLRTIEGLPEPGQEPDAGSVVTRELLTRRLPRTQNINLG
jgi:TolA-binding protein